MSILYIDLKTGEVRNEKDRDEKGFFLVHSLMGEGGEKIVFSSITDASLEISGALSSCYAFYSPLKERIEYGYMPSLYGLVLYNFGYTAMVIEGRADCLSYITMRGGTVEIRECENYAHTSFSAFSSAVREKDSDIVLATGKAADSHIKCSAIYENGREVGRGGFGYAFSSLNLKGICFQSLLAKRRSGDEDRRYLRALEKSKFAKRLKRDSTTGWIRNAERAAFLPIDGFERRHDARAIFLDGSYLKEKYGVYSAGCGDCPVSCGRLLQDGSPAPDITEAMALGSMQGIFSSDKVMLLKAAVNEAGLETVEAGAMLAGSSLSFEDKIRFVMDYNGASYKHYEMGGLSVLADLRGSGEAALFLMLGDSELPYYTLYAPCVIRNDRISAILALFERVYRYALSSRGLPVKGAYAAYCSSIPAFCYAIPELLRFILSRISFFGIKPSLLIKEGLEIIALIGEEDNPVDDHFVYTSSSTTERSVCNPTRLMMHYRTEKRRLEEKFLKNTGIGERK